MNATGSPPRNAPSSASVPSTPIASTSQLFGGAQASPMSSSSSSSILAGSNAVSTTPGSATSVLDSLSAGMTTPTPTNAPHMNGNLTLEGSNTSGNYTVRKTARAGPGIAPGNYTAQSPSVASTATTASGATATAISTAPLPPAASPGMAQPAPAWPALHLTPLNDTFVPKQISLFPPGNRVKIGRQTNAKTVPNNTNGYFDSKVLSRMHAEVWSEDGKVFIKDVKSSNGTFINGNRLSPEAAESEVFELHSDDQVEFGIDIVSDDSKTIVHHKVSARVFLVMNENDLSVSQRDFNRWYREAGENPMGRRGAKSVQSSTANGLSFEHVLNRMQGELQKSRDTGASLGDVSTTLNDVHDTLGGGMPPPLPPFSRIPPYGGGMGTNAAGSSRDPHAQSIAQLQSQLSETQSALSAHVAKIRDLEGIIREHDTLKREVGALRLQMDDAKNAMDSFIRARDREGRESPVARLLEADEDAHHASSRSLATSGDDNSTTSEQSLRDENASLTARLESLSASLERATSQSESLRQQHAAASSTIASLESKVQNLESAMKSQIDIVAWKDAFERDWHRDRQAWHAEREMLLDKVREWEQQSHGGRLRSMSSTSSPFASSSPVLGSSSSSSGALGGMRRQGSGGNKNRRRRRGSNSTTSDRDRHEREGSVSSDDTRTLSTDITSPSSSASSRGGTGGAGGEEATNGRSRARKYDWRSGAGERDRFGHGGLTWRSDGGQPPLAQYAGAGAIVVVGVAAAWLLSAKFKD